MTVADAATRYLHRLSGEAQLQSQQEVHRFVRWLGSNRALESLSSHEVATYAESLGSAADLVKKLEPVKAFLAWARKAGYTATNLSTSLRPPKATGRPTAKARREALQERAFLTPEGHQRLVAELEALKAERPSIAAALRHAMADKDFRENAPLDAAREHQAHLEARIRELEGLLQRAQVMEAGPSETVRAQLGSTVVVRDLASQEELRFTLVHPHEVDVAKGKISIASPIGKALLDHRAGEEVAVVAPAGVHRYHIRTIEAAR